MRVANMQMSINIPVTNSILKNMVRKCYSINQDFSVDYNCNLTEGYPMRLLSKSGTGSLSLYFEDFEHALKTWSRDFVKIYKYYNRKTLNLNDVLTHDCVRIVDLAVDHAMKAEGII